ncbi:replicative DNA helicase [Tetragenococcus muriaticus PMC-11-5]|uniref:Replicative DNA helicase n=1 Tax=Tetragenococcus muriaticus PMC-11-5 TaxID=1302649 RepID=A0A091C6B6_9ENTE|nr:DnaB-like helicase C-terminal domain-containing protein [Tetragenococcus muriaticus]KFN92414.1 replicative DNA helicase [Tetragenococcus muriaticus PMC-11-5]
METNFEMQFVSCLLKKPSLINDFDINLDWFEMDTMKSIVKAIQQSNGNDVLLTDIQKQIKDNDFFNQISLDELEVLQQQNAKSELIGLYLEQIHKNYLTEKLTFYTSEYAKTQNKKYLNIIDDLNEEMQAIDAEKDTGDIKQGYEDFVERMEGEVSPFIKTFGSFDDLLGGGLTRGSLYTIGARPAVGKSAMALSMAHEIVKRNQNVKVDYFSLEMPLDQLMIRFVSKETRIHSTHLRNPQAYPQMMTKDKKEKAVKAYERLEKLPIRFYTSEEMRKLNSIVRTIKKNAVQDNYVAIIDHALLIDAGIKADKRIQIIEITRRLKALSNALNIPIVLLTQLNRETDRSSGKPVMADLQESASFEQDSNVVALLYKEDAEDWKKLILNVAKNRDGMVGELPFKLLGQFSDFTEDFNRDIGGQK